MNMIHFVRRTSITAFHQNRVLLIKTLCKQIHTCKTTEERIKWLEANLTSVDICGKVQNLFHILHANATKNHQNPFEALKNNTGFTLIKDVSTVSNAGNGLFLEGKIPPASVVAIYPGVVYHPGDPSFFPSLLNDYVMYEIMRDLGYQKKAYGWLMR
eukprot:Phypoly_transcript_12701.p1 GENE.Phypoly_transcript_12701~~Phypoly_transcript_12701.p1  ORF type:complete len:157 (+),score=14.71 Phypoly_transcript_12701:204-674(+)